ncbi:MAG: methyltransferase domain-containing protein [Paludibacter sp.]|nr:methyltransferase domain-containing protein [Paludibacter sp.]
MKFSNEINEFLIGKKFSSGLDIHFSDRKYPDLTRIEKIIDLTRDKRIIHVGCADHLPLIDEKIKNKKWLHGLLNKSTAECAGVDINSEAVKYINEKLNINNVYLTGIETDKLLLQAEKKWDYMVLGEIIEHVDNPVAFLHELRTKYGKQVDKIIISAPNVFNLLTIKDIYGNKENINTDHRYWFSPFTLTKIILQSGYRQPEIYFVERVKLPLIKAVVKRLKMIFGIPLYFEPNCFSNIILVANF